MDHVQKRKLAERLKKQTDDPKPPFETKAWEERATRIRAKHEKRNAGEHMRAIIEKGRRVSHVVASSNS